MLLVLHVPLVIVGCRSTSPLETVDLQPTTSTGCIGVIAVAQLSKCTTNQAVSKLHKDAMVDLASFARL